MCQWDYSFNAERLIRPVTRPVVEGCSGLPVQLLAQAIYTGVIFPPKRTRHCHIEAAGDSVVHVSYIERSNLTLRMGSRRFTRLTNAFSKKLENHAHAVALHYTHYNWCRIHKILRVTPAIEAGLTDHVWSLEELVGLLEH